MSTRLLITAGVAAVATLAAGCSSSSSAGSTSSRPAGSSTAASPTTVTIAVANGRLTGTDGKTLYYNSLDTAKSIKCVGACAGIWPPVAGTPKLGAGLDDDDFTTATRPDGGLQVVFYGHPLYEFSGDKAAGTANGDGLPDAGGTWTVATPDQAGSDDASESSGSPAAPSTPADDGASSAPDDNGGGYTYP